MRERGILGGDTSGTSLVDVLDRVLQRGAFVSGDVVISLAGIDLARLDLRLLLTGIESVASSQRLAGDDGRLEVTR